MRELRGPLAIARQVNSESALLPSTIETGLRQVQNLANVSSARIGNVNHPQARQTAGLVAGVIGGLAIGMLGAVASVQAASAPSLYVTGPVRGNSSVVTPPAPGMNGPRG